jgi:uncharacterized protein
MLYRRGFFQSNLIDRIENPHSDYIEGLLSGGMNDLVLQVTQKCNFNCRYCLYSGKEEIERTHTNTNMNRDVAFKAVDYLAKHSYDSPTIHISFYGGEPLLNMELIYAVTNYVKTKFFSKRIEFSLTTNGSLLNNEVLSFFEKNDFKVSISLDGPKEVQDKHRRARNGVDGTYLIVYSNLQIIKKTFPDFYKHNLLFLPVIIDDEDYSIVKEYFSEEGIAPDRITPLKANLNGIDYYLSASNINNSSLKFTNVDSGGINEPAFENLYRVYKDKTTLPRIWHHNGQCIPGIQRLFVDVDGFFYPCEKIIENEGFRIGSIYDGINYEKAYQFANVGKLSEKECKHCWAMRFCELCISQCIDCESKDISSEVKRRVCESQKEKALWTFKKIIDKDELNR